MKSLLNMKKLLKEKDLLFNINYAKGEGSALIMVIWITLILSILLLTVTDRLSIERTLYSEFDAFNAARRKGCDVFQLIVANLQSDETEYDIPEEIVFFTEGTKEADYSGVTVELWDEGSRFNPNNAPLPLLTAFFEGESETRDSVYDWIFRKDRYSQTIVRNNYFLSNAELKTVLFEDEEDSDLLDSMTVFGPAILSLMDGEVMLSILQRWGEDYDEISGLRIINDFNQIINESRQGQRELEHFNTFAEIASRLHIDLKMEQEVIDDLLITTGGINPNFVDARYLNAIFKDTENDFDDIYEYRENKPFTEKSGLEFYLQVLHNLSISKEEIWKIFTLETKIWGMSIKVPISTERFYQIKAVLRRKGDESVSRARGSKKIKVLYYKEEIEVNN